MALGNQFIQTAVYRFHLRSDDKGTFVRFTLVYIKFSDALKVGLSVVGRSPIACNGNETLIESKVPESKNCIAYHVTPVMSIYFYC